jgi:hypothetical protein
VRLVVALLCLLPAVPVFSQLPNPAELPDAPSQVLIATATEPVSSSSADQADPFDYSFYPDGYQSQNNSQDAAAQAAKDSDHPRPSKNGEFDANGNPIPLSRQQPKRILGFMPNFRSVSGGAVPPPPTWKNNFKVATRQSFDYSSFIFLGITSMSAEGINAHPVLGKGVDGFWAYTWRGFLDKTDGTYLGAFFLPSLLREDTRYFAMGNEHSVPIRILYVMSRQVVARTYHGHQTPNIAGLGAKVLTQIVSRTYYPAGSTDFGVLATKFGYATMRDISFTAVREFYPDIAAHYIRKHREKVAALSARDTAAVGPNL